MKPNNFNTTEQNNGSSVLAELARLLARQAARESFSASASTSLTLDADSNPSPVPKAKNKEHRHE